MQHIFRSLAKPNQIINRQEIILNMINSTIKSKRFLRSFVELQHAANGALRKSKMQNVNTNTNSNDSSSKKSSKVQGNAKQTKKNNTLGK